MEIIVKKPTDEEKETAKEWPIWEKEASLFPWEYETSETCHVLEGKAIVTPENGEPVEFGAGDWVVFPKGMRCTWEVTEKIKKHYNFS